MTLSLARRAERFPERTAVVDISEERLYAPAETIHENRVSYGELSRMAERTAEHLSALGVGAGDVVCLVTRNRVASLASLFACRRLEATLFPISHWLTPASVERPFEIVDPDLVVSEAAQRDLVRSIPYDRTVTLEELADADREDVPDREARGRDFAADAPLLLLHGDDGRPVAKYFADALERNCCAALVAWGLSAADVAPLTAPLSSPDGLVRAALPLLYVGATVLLDRAFDPGDALTAIEAENATVLLGRGRTVRDLAAESDFDAAVDTLQRVVYEGALDGDDVRTAYRERGVALARAFGRLECPTVFGQSVSPSDRDPAPGSEAEAADTTAVGPPMPDCRVRLVDSDGAVLEAEDEAEAEGRLQLSGPTLADGYVNAAGTDDENDRGRFEEGRITLEETVRRDADGNYHLP